MISKLSVRRPSPALVVAFIALLLALGGVAFAAIPDSDDGEIHGCYANNNGALRVIDAQAGQTCNTSRETALTWNQRGPQGVPGTGARAYAEVVSHAGSPCLPDCQLLRSEGVTNVTMPTTGGYCVFAPGLSPDNAAVALTVSAGAVNGGGTAEPDGNASALFAPQGNCSGGFLVFTERLSVTGGTDSVVADDIGFTIAIL